MGSLTRVDGENIPGIHSACTIAILRILQEAHDISPHRMIDSLSFTIYHGCTIISCQLIDIGPEKAEFLFHYWAIYNVCKKLGIFWAKIVFHCLRITLSSSSLSERIQNIELIKYLSIYSSSARLSESYSLDSLCNWGGVSFLVLTMVMIFVSHPIFIIKSEILFISHCAGLGHETIVCDVRFVMLLFRVISKVYLSTQAWKTATCWKCWELQY